MLFLLSKDSDVQLLGLPKLKKVAFLTMLYGRLAPELRLFCSMEGIGVARFEDAYEQFWQFLANPQMSVAWDELGERILQVAPDSETYGTALGAFALNAALVAAEIAKYIADGADTHIIDSIGYAIESLHAKVSGDLGVFAYSDAIETQIAFSPLVQRERLIAEDDIALLRRMPDVPWSTREISELRLRAEARDSIVSI